MIDFGEPRLDFERANLLDEMAWEVVLSYRFSQGSLSNHDALFEFIHLERPEWRLDDETKLQLVDRIVPAAEELLSGNVHIDADSLGKYDSESVEDYARKIVVRDMRKFGATLEAPERRDARRLAVERITDRVIARDYKYLVFDSKTGRKERGRPGTSRGQVEGMIADPWLSHLCYFGFEGDRHTTQSEIFDKLFQEVAAVARTFLDTETPVTGRAALDTDKVVRRYLATHPGKEREEPYLTLLAGRPADEALSVK